MEGNKKQVGSSFTSDLFGCKESQKASSTTRVFDSIFPPPSAVLGRNSSSSEVLGSWQKQNPGNQDWNTQKGSPGKNGEGVNNSKKDRNSIFQEGRVEPCQLSSSIYYGGQESYSHSPSTQTTGSYPIFKKHGEDDDPNSNNSQSASRGNWWQGSLYY